MNVEIAGAIARGYCSEKNSHKVLDPDLVEAMAVEVEKLLSNKEPNCLTGEKKVVLKPWGKEIWLSLDKYCYKRIYINAGYRTSLQYHNYKSETNYIISGEAKVLIGETWYDAKANDYFVINPGVVHRVVAITDIVLQEASTPETSDVIRLEDDTNRPDGKIESEHNVK
jgi:mannose-6-phosphate isomerase-like protein (cupin superfamily)